MDKVATDGKGIVGTVATRRIVSREIEHDKKVAHLHNLCIARDNAGCFMAINGIALVALPVFHVVAKSYTDALSFQLVGWIDAAGIVEHHKTLAQRALGVVIYRTFILYQLLPPLRILIVDGHHRARQRLPFVGFADIACSPCQSNM